MRYLKLLILLVHVGGCGSANKPAVEPNEASEDHQGVHGSHDEGSEPDADDVEPAPNDVEVPPAP